MGVILIRAIILALMTAAGYFYPPFHLCNIGGSGWSGSRYSPYLVGEQAAAGTISTPVDRVSWSSAGSSHRLAGWLYLSICLSGRRNLCFHFDFFSDRFSLHWLFAGDKKTGMV